MPEEKRILLLKDEPTPPDVRNLLLSKMGYVVREISDPDQIIITAREFQPHLIMIDHSKPARSALAIRMLKGHVLLRPISIICFLQPDNSGKPPAEPGADAWLKKPFDISHLRELIEKLLNRPE